ncbi:MAG: RNA methyltransferase [Deltaproteobacteria bacterium]|nr:RNA methyltransferase [Deltaproteobacteria bacterium]
MTLHSASLPLSTIQNRFHVVLVEPGDSLNVGSVARAMNNLGFTQLHLVAPPRLDLERAATTACWASDVLRTMKIHETLEQALAGMQQVVGFTARHGQHRPQHLVLPEWCGVMEQTPAEATALVFGPEDHGLRAEHVNHCRWLVRIPSNAENPSFNLSQAVLLTLFELSRRTWPEQASAESSLPAPMKDFYRLERMAEESLTRSGFLGKGAPRPMLGLIKNLLRRIEPNEREMRVLLGMFDHINRTLSGRAPVQPWPAENGRKAEGQVESGNETADPVQESDSPEKTAPRSYSRGKS